MVSLLKTPSGGFLMAPLQLSRTVSRVWGGGAVRETLNPVGDDQKMTGAQPLRGFAELAPIGDRARITTRRGVRGDGADHRGGESRRSRRRRAARRVVRPAHPCPTPSAFEISDSNRRRRAGPAAGRARSRRLCDRDTRGEWTRSAAPHRHSARANAQRWSLHRCRSPSRSSPRPRTPYRDRESDNGGIRPTGKLLGVVGQSMRLSDER
jgi:hypothetical protein